MSAPACLVQSNDNIEVDPTALLSAAVVHAGGEAKGHILPAGQSEAAAIADPFQGYDVDIPSGCPAGKAPVTKVSGAQTLAPGLHCGGFELSGTAVLTLAPGEHYFIGDLKADQSARVEGSDVVLIFDKDSKFDFKGQSSVALQGRTSGALSGFVVITTRSNDHDFHIQSSHVDQLLGTIYVPNAQLVVEGDNNKVAQASKWTVVVAKQLEMHDTATLVINADYAGSSVPVPGGVGPNIAARGAKLID